MASNRRDDLFSGRTAIILAALGMAIGTGNIWRFPRMAAQYGGGSFLIPWFIFLFTWSIPLLIAEMAMGKTSQGGVLKAVRHFGGQRCGWLGTFITVCTACIGFYYCVTSGWCLRYFYLAVTHGPLGSDSADNWGRFESSSSAVWFFLLAILLAATILLFGIHRGIERMSKIVIPALFVMLIICMIRALTLPGGLSGAAYLFTIDPDHLWNSRTWLEAMAQSAWSTGAGMGLLLTYAAFAREGESSVFVSTASSLGNNVASILAGLMILPTVFALLEPVQATAVMAEGSTGLTFVWLPRLFGDMTGGWFFMILFFAALYFASLTSLMAMMQLLVNCFGDMGLSRIAAVALVVLLCVIFGLPSALSMAVFDNQDWVWGVGLVLSGLFFCIVVLEYGVDRFRTEQINVVASDIHLGSWFNWSFRILIPLQFVVLFGWVIWENLKRHSSDWWYPFSNSLGTCLLQWGLVIGISYGIHKWRAARK